MTTPPTGEDNGEEHPPPAYPLPGPYPVPGYPGQPGYPSPPGYPPPHPYGPPTQSPSKISVGAAVGGAFAYFALNFVVALLLLMFASSYHSSTVVIGGGAVLLALIAFGGGGVLLATRSPTGKGLGLGLMIGWALTSVFTVGFCTGINPAMYT